MDIIDTIFQKLDKHQAPGRLRAQVLAIAHETTPKPRHNLAALFMGVAKFAIPVMLLGAVLGGAYYQFFRTANLAVAFELIPESKDAAGIRPNSAFILKTSKRLTHFQIRKAVQFNPSVEYDIESAGSNTYRLTPRGDLQVDQIYRIIIPEGVGDRDYSWAYQVKAPFQVISTVPGDKSTHAPVAAGIEITLNREGFLNPEQYFEISPKVDGNFEQYGTVLIFKPTKPLASATVYTVTLKKGLPIKNSTDALEVDYSFQFETTVGNSVRSYVYFPKDFTEYPQGKPVFQVYGSVSPESSNATVYQFKDPDSFAHHYTQSRSWNLQWTTYNNKPDTQQFGTAAQKVTEFKPTIQQQSSYYSGYGQSYLEIPQELREGYYALEITLPEGQAIYQWFQVTPIAHYGSFSNERSLVWLYDFTKKQPLADATITIVGGGSVDSTNGEGLAQFNTPSQFVANSHRTNGLYYHDTTNLLKVERAGYRPYFMRAMQLESYAQSGFREAEQYWETLTTDRPFYQVTDTVRFFGSLKSRTGNLEENATVKVNIYNAGWYNPWYSFNSDTSIKPFVQTEVTVQDDGTYEGSLSFTGLTSGYYSIITEYQGKAVSFEQIRVFTYSKPAYKLTVTTDRQTYFVDEPIKYTIKAEFFDGTPVSNLVVHYGGYWHSDIGGSVTTNQQGIAEYTTRLPYINEPGSPFDNYQSPWPRQLYLYWQPDKSEEGVIGANTNVTIFGPRVLLGLDQDITKEGLNTFTISAHQVDINRKPSQIWDTSQYEGQPIANQEVEAQVRKTTYTRVETGQYYDYINKVSYPTYRYDKSEAIIETFRGRTDSQGVWKVQKKYPYEENTYYDILFTTRDAQRLPIYIRGYYSHIDYRYAYNWFTGQPIESNDLQPVLALEGGVYNGSQNEYSVGQQITMNVKYNNPHAKLPTAEPKVLFYNYQQSIKKAAVVTGLQFNDSFDQEFKPSVNYRAVLLGPNGFEETYPVTTLFKREDARLNIEIKTDKDAYQPKDKVKVTVKVTDQRGDTVAAKVNLAIVDEALFAVDYFYQQNILDELYRSVTIEPLISLTHYTRTALPSDGSGGGGGDSALRQKFEDTALFQTVETGGNGAGEIEFTLPDNITSWRITARAYQAENLLAGQEVKNIASGLPFFVDTTLASTYLVGDTPTLRVRLFGTEYNPGNDTAVTVTNQSLGVAVNQTVKNGIVLVPLPALKEGRYDIRIRGEQGKLVDEVQRTITVVPSYFVKPASTTYQVTDGLTNIAGNDNGVTRLVFSDRGRGQYIPALSWYAYSAGLRLDQRAVAHFAQKTLHDQFGVGPVPDPIDITAFLRLADPSSYDPESFAGLSMFTYGDPDLATSALTAGLLPDLVPKKELIQYFNSSLIDRKSDIHRVSIALYGLAALDQPVLSKLQDIATDSNLSLEDQLYIAAGLAELGDKEGARKLYFDKIRSNLKREGNQAYLVDNDETHQIKLTTKAGMVAAYLNIREDLDQLWMYTDIHFPTKDLNYLERGIMIKQALQNNKTKEASFKYRTNQGERSGTLEGGRSQMIEMLADERKSFQITDVDGDIQLVSLYETSTDPNSITSTGNLSITRQYRTEDNRPVTSFTDGQIIRVVLTIGPQNLKTDQVYQVTDFLPSGLRSLNATYVSSYGSFVYDPDPCSQSYWYPDVSETNRVGFSIYPNSLCRNTPIEITYYARVVSPGTFTADPAWIAPTNDLETISVTKRAQIHIKP